MTTDASSNEPVVIIIDYLINLINAFFMSNFMPAFWVMTLSLKICTILIKKKSYFLIVNEIN